MSPEGKIKKENYIECPACTAEIGERVVYHKSAFVEEDDLFGDSERRCPRGHAVPAVKS